MTPYHGDKASFLGWKWSFLIAVRAISKPLHEGLKKFEDNMNQDCRKSRLSNEIWRFQIRPTNCERCFAKMKCTYVRSAEDGNGYQAWRALLRARAAPNATNLVNQFTGTNIQITRPTHQSSTMEQKKLRSTRHEPVNA